MTEETNEVVEETTTSDPIEEKALAAGWKPLEEWDGDPTEWRDAKTFVDRGELLNKIHQQNRTMKELRTILDDMKNQVVNLTKQQLGAYENALKNKRKEFIEEGNSSEVDKVDRMIEEVRKQQPQVSNGPTASEQKRIQEVFNDFKKSNPWFESDAELTSEANQISQLKMQAAINEYQQATGRQKTYFTPEEAEEIFEFVSKEVRKRNPNKFKNQKKASPPSVEGTEKGSSSSGNKKQYTMRDVPEDYREMVKRFTRQGVLTVHEYVESLKAQGVI